MAATSIKPSSQTAESDHLEILASGIFSHAARPFDLTQRGIECRELKPMSTSQIDEMRISDVLTPIYVGQ